MIPEPWSPPCAPRLSCTATTLGWTAAATAVQFGFEAVLLTSGAEFCDELDPLLLENGWLAGAVLPSRASTMPAVSRLASTAAPAPTAKVPIQPGPRRSRGARGCCGAGEPYGVVKIGEWGGCPGPWPGFWPGAWYGP